MPSRCKQSTINLDAFLVLIPQLLHMYSQCLRLIIFPDCWKLANIIQKPGDPTDVNNLRPISLLPLPGKVLEKMWKNSGRGVHHQYVNQTW